MRDVEFLIMGAGPTGLGAAWRLHEKGRDQWLIVDPNEHPGGLAASFIDSYGFTWDFAVHVAHSHYYYVDRLMDDLLPDGFYYHQRKSWVRLYDVWVPYPFQYNFRHLPLQALQDCVQGLRASRLSSLNERNSFRDWILASFGEGIANHFMIPYNKKIWTVDPAEMSYHWLGDRVPTVDLERVERNIRDSRDDVAWGPNAVFQFPKRGGTGAIWAALSERLPRENMQLSTSVRKIDQKKRCAELSDGSQVRFEKLISTVPLPVLANLLVDEELAIHVSGLRHSQVQVAGVGVRRPIPEELSNKTWVYCPEDKAEFYRVTPFSTFSPAHVPDPQNQCSFLCEFSSSDSGRFIERDLEKLAVDGLRNLGLLDLKPDEYHIFNMQSEFGYPIPTLNRDAILHEVIPNLESKGIYSRGRFGGWKYEVANMDHSLMQGVEAINHALDGEDQPTFYCPNHVNTGKK